MSYEPATLWACVDCMLAEANGTDPEHMSAEQLATWRADRARWQGDVTHYSVGGHYSCGLGDESLYWDDDVRDADDIHHEHDFTCERVDFSWNMCERCGSRLGGERYALTGWFD